MIDKVRLELVAGNRVRVIGNLLFSNVNALLTASDRLFVDQQELVFDLAQVEHSDSSALALMLELKDRARALGVQVYFDNLPSSLLDVAELSNATGLLPVKG